MSTVYPIPARAEVCKALGVVELTGASAQYARRAETCRRAGIDVAPTEPMIGAMLLARAEILYWAACYVAAGASSRAIYSAEAERCCDLTSRYLAAT
jgi:hypothetical protein